MKFWLLISILYYACTNIILVKTCPTINAYNNNTPMITMHLTSCDVRSLLIPFNQTTMLPADRNSVLHEYTPPFSMLPVDEDGFQKFNVTTFDCKSSCIDVATITMIDSN